jgi:hypothetical protein
MECQACGKQIEPDSNYCRVCGAAQQAVDVAPESLPAPDARTAEPSEYRPLWILGGLLLVAVIAILAFSQGTSPPLPDRPPSATDIVDNLTGVDAMAAGDLSDVSKNIADADAAVPTPPAETWTYTTGEDKVRGATSYFATTTSTNSVELDAPYDGGSTLRMTVRQSSAQGADVILVLSSGQLLCRAYDGCYATVRFDQKPAERIELVEASDNSSDTVFVSETPAFIAKLKKARKVIVELEIYEAGRPQFEFDVAGLKWEH